MGNPTTRKCQCVCVKCGSAGANMCKMHETVRVISHILHMVNSDLSEGKS